MITIITKIMNYYNYNYNNGEKVGNPKLPLISTPNPIRGGNLCSPGYSLGVNGTECNRRCDRMVFRSVVVGVSAMELGSRKSEVRGTKSFCAGFDIWRVTPWLSGVKLVCC